MRRQRARALALDQGSKSLVDEGGSFRHAGEALRFAGELIIEIGCRAHDGLTLRDALNASSTDAGSHA
jgi:hypothetical protein